MADLLRLRLTRASIDPSFASISLAFPIGCRLGLSTSILSRQARPTPQNRGASTIRLVRLDCGNRPGRRTDRFGGPRLRPPYPQVHRPTLQSAPKVAGRVFRPRSRKGFRPMNRKIAAPALAMMALAGCNLDRSEIKKKAIRSPRPSSTRTATAPGDVLEPKYCKLDSAIISRPVGDAVVDASPWNIADEQSIPIEARQALEANGIRVGDHHREPPRRHHRDLQGQPSPEGDAVGAYRLPEGERSPIVVGAKTESASRSCSTTRGRLTAGTTRTPRAD